MEAVIQSESLHRNDTIIDLQLDILNLDANAISTNWSVNRHQSRRTIQIFIPDSSQSMQKL